MRRLCALLGHPGVAVPFPGPRERAVLADASDEAIITPPSLQTVWTIPSPASAWQREVRTAGLRVARRTEAPASRPSVLRCNCI